MSVNKIAINGILRCLWRKRKQRMSANAGPKVINDVKGPGNLNKRVAQKKL